MHLRNSILIIASIIIALVVLMSVIPLIYNPQIVNEIHIGNQTNIEVHSSYITDKVYPLIYVILGALISFLINEIISKRNEKKIITVLKSNLNLNLEILKFNNNKLDMELVSKGINYIPLKLFNTDYWNLINFNLSKKFIDDELYNKISKATLIMDSFNEMNQLKEYHKFFKDERVVNVRIINNYLKKEINELSSLLNEILEGITD